MFCSQCGANNADEAIFCQICGKRLEEKTNDNSTLLASPPLSASPYESSPYTTYGSSEPIYPPPPPHPTTESISYPYEHLPSTRAPRNIKYLIVIAILIIMLITAGVLIGILVEKGNIPGSANNTSIITNPTPTQAPLTPIPTPTATPKTQTYIVSVSASQDLPGVNTGISVSIGERISIVAQGLAYYGGEGQPCSGNPATLPDGTRSVNGQPCPPKPDPNAALSGANIGLLLGNIGQGWFAIGNSDQFTATTGGILFLLYNDVPGHYGDNSGSYQVTVTVG